MLLKIVQAGDPVLRKTAKKLSKAKLAESETQKLINYMIKTLRDFPGVGLAAPQVGESLQIIVIEDLKKYHKPVSAKILKQHDRKPVELQIIINPVLFVLDDAVHHFFEGCLSVEGYRAIVPRAHKIRVSGLNRDGKNVTITAEGWHARILQHEIDHLNGALYTDVMHSTSFMTAKNYALKWHDADNKKLKTLFTA